MAVVRNIVDTLPKDKAALLKVKGMGAKRVKMYGSKILKCVAFATGRA